MKIVYMIDSLKRGGAEILLKNSINLLTEHEHVVVYFNDEVGLQNEFPANARLIYVKHKGWNYIFKTVGRLKKIIHDEEPSLVHSHLFLSSILARLATPRNIPLINTLHSAYSMDAFKKNMKSVWAERFTLKKYHSLIAVSEFVLGDYLAYVPFKGNKYVLYNFLPDYYFKAKMNISRKSDILRCVAVGTLKEAKNYPYLLKIMERVKGLPIELDIYGEGPLRANLQHIINERKLKVRLPGAVGDIKKIHEDYDLFVQASTHEGFGLSIIEAMSSKLPLLISDIPVFREITGSQAHFFPLDSEEKAAEILIKLSEDINLLHCYAVQAYEYANTHYTAIEYRNKILEIYRMT